MLKQVLEIRTSSGAHYLAFHKEQLEVSKTDGSGITAWRSRMATSYIVKHMLYDQEFESRLFNPIKIKRMSTGRLT